VDAEIATLLRSVPLWRMLSLLTFSGAAMATFDRLFTAASEESKIKLTLATLRTRVSAMELKLSTRRKHGCLVIVNLPQLLHDIDCTKQEIWRTLSCETIRAGVLSQVFLSHQQGFDFRVHRAMHLHFVRGGDALYCQS
jgi:hypothetical protein